MIFVHKNTVTGLTTAVGIWATSGVGLAIGAGMYIVGISATILVLIAQVVLHKHFRRLKNTKLKKLIIKNVTTEDYQAYMTNVFLKQGITIHDAYIEKNGDVRNYTFIIEMPQNIYEDNIISVTNHDCKIMGNI